MCPEAEPQLRGGGRGTQTWARGPGVLGCPGRTFLPSRAMYPPIFHCKGDGGVRGGFCLLIPLFSFQGFLPAPRLGRISFQLCRVSRRDANPLFIYFSWKLTSCCILMTPGLGALAKMLNIRSLSVILQHFGRGRGVWALATALKTPVCLLSGADGLKPSPISCRSVFLCSFSPIRTVGKSGCRAELSFLPITPNRRSYPHPAPFPFLPVPNPLDAQFQSPSSVGAVGPLVFCRERDKDHHLPPSPCTANASARTPRLLCSPEALGRQGVNPQAEAARREK